jgi:hypothetical protein
MIALTATAAANRKTVRSGSFPGLESTFKLLILLNLWSEPEACGGIARQPRWHRREISRSPL